MKSLPICIAAVAFASIAAAPALAQVFQPGQTVLAAPGHFEAAYTRCVVVERVATVPGQPDNYKLDCVNAHPNVYGRKVQTVTQGAWVRANWVKPNDPAFHPDWQLTARAQDSAWKARVATTDRQLARPLPRFAATTPAPAAGGAPRAGSYECWANGYARMNMNFRVTGPGAYRNDSGAGRFSVGPGGKLALTGPMLESLPAGFIVVYHAPGGKPTFSFRSPRGAEAAFCEHAG